MIGIFKKNRLFKKKEKSIKIKFIVNIKKLNKNRKKNKRIKEITIGQFNEDDDNTGFVFLPNIYKAVKSELKNKFTTDNIIVEEIIGKTCNTIVHETLHGVVKHNIPVRNLVNLPLPVTAQEWIVRRMLGEEGFPLLLNYMVKDFEIKLGIDVLFSDYLLKKLNHSQNTIILYQTLGIIIVTLINDLPFKILFYTLYTGLMIFYILGIRKVGVIWRKKRSMK